MRRVNVIRAPDETAPPVGGEDHYRCDGALQRPVQVCERLDVEHVHLVDEENSRHQLGDALVDVLVHHLVDLATQLVGDLGFFRFQQLAHHGEHVLAALRLRVGRVQIVQGHVLKRVGLLKVGNFDSLGGSFSIVPV